MANGNTCAGSDNTAPEHVLDEVRRHVRHKKEDDPNSPYKNRQHLDDWGPADHPYCLLEDLGGKACTGDDCAYATGGKKIPYDDSKKKRTLDKPKCGCK